MTKVLIGSDQQRNAVKKLAFFEPMCSDGSGLTVLDYLVLEACFTSGELLQLTSQDIQDYIKEIYFINFEVAEINSSGEKLSKKGKIEYSVNFTNKISTFKIIKESEEEITNNIRLFEKKEEDIIQEWSDILINKYSEYPIVIENLGKITENLKIFITKIFISHGIESVALLYPEDQKTNDWLDSVKNHILEDLPKHNEFIDNICLVEIPNFFKTKNSNRLEYISNLFNSSFVWHMMQIDDSCSKMITEVVKGQRLFLDNNILFSLIGIHGTSSFKSVHLMLDMANKLEYSLFVSTKTVDEFHNSLKWQLRKFQEKPFIPKDLARLAMEHLENDDFLTTYWKEYIRNNTSIEDFINEKSHLENILEGLNITVTDEFRNEIEKDKRTLNKEKSILKTLCYNAHDAILEHDSFHRILITKIRKSHKYHYNEAEAWFLTHDSKLPVYGRIARKGDTYLPFCLTTSQWIQINRPLLSRIDKEGDLEKSFLALVTQPYLRTFMSTFSLEKNVTKVLNKLSQLKNISPQMAAKFFTDKQFILVTVTNEINNEDLDKEIDIKFLEIAEEYENENIAFAKDLQIKDQKIDKINSELNNIKSEFLSFKEQSDDEKEKFKEEINSIKDKYESREKEIVLEDKEIITSLKSKIDWIVFGFLLIIFSFILWSHNSWLSWAWFDKNSNQIIFKISGQLFIISTLLTIPLKKHLAILIPSVLCIVLAILGFALK